jgi:hypothetical protein
VANLVSALALLRAAEHYCFSVASIIRFVTPGEEGANTIGRKLSTLLVDILLVRIEENYQFEMSIVAVH